MRIENISPLYERESVDIVDVFPALILFPLDPICKCIKGLFMSKDIIPLTTIQIGEQTGNEGGSLRVATPLVRVILQ